MTLMTVSVRVSKRRTSPDREALGKLDEEDVWPAVESGEVGDGTGDG